MNHAFPSLVCLGVALLVAGCGASYSEPAEKTSVAEQPPMPTAMRVQVSSIVAARVDRAGSVTGVVSAFRKATVAAEVSGRVVKRLIEPGATVAEDEVLIELDRHRAQLAVAHASAIADASGVDRTQAAHEYQRGRNLFAKSVISQERLDDLRFAVERAESQLLAANAELATANRSLADTRVLAPFRGTAEIVHVQVGDYLKSGTAVATLTDFSRVRVHAGVTAAEANSLVADQTATLSFEALGGVALPGRVQNVSRIADDASGTYPVEIWLEGPQAQRLREGMVASVNLPSPAITARPVAPTAAIFRRDGGTHVYTVLDDRAKLTRVRVGHSNGELVEILEGVVVGDVVVVDGLFALRDGSNVTVDHPL